MKYSVQKLAEEYIKYLESFSFEVKSKPLTSHDYSTYNEYKYRKIMLQYDKIYNHTDSTTLTEHFLKGD